MIIVEGPDGAGKTTLINQLVERYGLEVAPRVVSPDTKDLVDLKVWVDKNLDDGFQWKLFDRHRLISEFCYGPTLRQEQRPGFLDMDWVHFSLWRLYTKVQPLIIYCLPPFETVHENIHRADTDNSALYGHSQQIYAAYLERSTMDQLVLPGKVLVWDYTRDYMLEDNPLSFFDYYMNRAKERANR